ncbi:MAG: hypothetical protein AAF810_16190 [Cyanobacteria bacterium P01_D01_bin.36]
MTGETDGTSTTSAGSKRVKVISTVLMFGAIALQIWQAITPLPVFLQPIAKITAIVLAIHAVEGLISAILILRYRLSLESGADSAVPQSNALLTQKLPKSTPLAVFKAGLYAFFVGTVGLIEVFEAAKPPKKPSLESSS